MFRLKFSTMSLRCAFLIGSILIAQSPEDPVDRARITRVIEVMASRDHRRIADLVHYPLGQGYPVQPIRNKQECIKRFDELFDDALLSEITASSPEEDWQRVGWRGIIFKAGALWLNDDYEIFAINHETEKAKAVRAKRIDADKNRLPIKLRDFDEPELEWTTTKHLIRVDQKGEDYRLLVFKRGSRKVPLLELHHGVFELDGQLGDFHYSWQSNGITYRVISSIGDDPSESYCIYDGLVDPLDWPEKARVTEKRVMIPPAR